jgi:hypothetical protein
MIGTLEKEEAIAFIFTKLELLARIKDPTAGHVAIRLWDGISVGVRQTGSPQADRIRLSTGMAKAY